MAFLCVVGFTRLAAGVVPAIEAPSRARPTVWVGVCAAPQTSHVLVELATDPASAGLAGRVDPHLRPLVQALSGPSESIDALLTTEAANPAVLRGARLCDDGRRRARRPLYPRQWHMPQVQAEQAWDVTTGDGVIVAVLDSGIDPNGEDGFLPSALRRIQRRRQFDPPGAALDDLNHGTHVAGTVAGCAGNYHGRRRPGL